MLNTRKKESRFQAGLPAILIFLFVSLIFQIGTARDIHCKEKESRFYLVSVGVGNGDKKQPWVLEQQSDSQGLVHIKLSDKGPWTFNVSHKTPYPDTSECDSYSYRTSLTIDF